MSARDERQRVTENPQEFLMRTLSKDQWRVVAEALRVEVAAALADDPAQATLARVEALAVARLDGDDIVRVTISPIPGVGIGQRTGTYVSQNALRAALAGGPTVGNGQ